MRDNRYWNIFEQSGDPYAYIAYRQSLDSKKGAKKTKEKGDEL